MTISTDPHASAIVNSAMSWGLRGNLTEARRYLADLTPAQHTELTLKLVMLLTANEELVEQKTATALLTPDCPSLPDGVEGYAVNGIHTASVCTWCGRMDCKTREEHKQLHRVSETTWRRNAKGIRT